MVEKKLTICILPNRSPAKLNTQFIVHELTEITMEISEQGRLIKCVVVGDAGVGKSALIQSYIDDFTPFGIYMVTTSGDYYEKEFGEGTVPLRIFDPVGNVHHIQEILYEEANVFVICFSFDDRYSFANALTKWFREVRFYRGDAPVILVGTKLDNKKRGLVQPEDGVGIVTKHDGFLMMTGMCTEAYVECSAVTTHGVKRVFIEVIDAFVRSNSLQMR